MFENLHVESIDEFLNNKDFLWFLIDNVQDGVSVLTPDLTLVYVNDAMRRWYQIGSSFPYEKCYKLYHDLDTPCENCPAVRAMQERKKSDGIQRKDSDNSECGTVELNKFLITNANGDVVLIIGLTKDVSVQKNLEKEIADLKESFSILEQQNSLLLSSLQLREKQFDELNATIQTNIEQFVRPSLEHLKNKVDENDVDVVSSVIDSVVYPITKKRIPRLKELTSREMQVAALVRDGYTSKQIAEELFISKKAVDFHRANIRKKLKLDPDVNMQRYLEMNM